jgi:hypothetical protein
VRETLLHRNRSGSGHFAPADWLNVKEARLALAHAPGSVTPIFGATLGSVEQGMDGSMLPVVEVAEAVAGEAPVDRRKPAVDKSWGLTMLWLASPSRRQGADRDSSRKAIGRIVPACGRPDLLAVNPRPTWVSRPLGSGFEFR